jgi:hypothetical protein
VKPGCLLVRRRLLPYLEDALDARAAAGLERHLAACDGCAQVLARLRSGHEAGRSFGRLAPTAPARLPRFEEVRAERPAFRRPFPAAAVPATLALAVLLAAAVLFTARTRAVRPPKPATGPFTELAISDFETGLDSRVVTEGFVQNVYFDEEERTLHIKLAESPLGQGPFVICEVRDARGLDVPAVGSRIRVYGRSRYDAQPGRGWHEVNPVMQIAVLNR